MAKEIIKNLILGDMNSVSKNADCVFCVAEELYPVNNNSYKYFLDRTFYYKLTDFPGSGEISPKIINEILENLLTQLDQKKKVYIHCVYGVNRSASITFMYLVRNNLLKSSGFKDNYQEFKKIYPYFSPNPGWNLFLKEYYPYGEKELLK